MELLDVTGQKEEREEGRFCFKKYQGTGNDFIMIDDRTLSLSFDRSRVVRLCHRHYGIGGDGIVILQPSSRADYQIRVFVSDGTEVPMCGNGLRCVIAFLYDLGIKQSEFMIETGAGLYRGWKEGRDLIKVSAPAPEMVEEGGVLLVAGKKREFTRVNTGVDHVVCFVDHMTLANFAWEARQWRFHPYFSPGGVYVDMVVCTSRKKIEMRTYEKWIETETLSCGTGALAACTAAWSLGYIDREVEVFFPRAQAELVVECVVEKGKIQTLMMTGRVQQTFSGIWDDRS